MNVDLWKEHPTIDKLLLIHLQILNETCKALTQNWPCENETNVLELTYISCIHVPVFCKGAEEMCDVQGTM